MRMLSVLLIPTALAAGCTTDDTARIDGLSYEAGDAIAANTVLQIVDPWQDGVQHTDLRVPAQRVGAVSASADGADAPAADSGGPKTTSDK